MIRRSWEHKDNARFYWRQQIERAKQSIEYGHDDGKSIHKGREWAWQWLSDYGNDPDVHCEIANLDRWIGTTSAFHMRPEALCLSALLLTAKALRQWPKHELLQAEHALTIGTILGLATADRDNLLTSLAMIVAAGAWTSLTGPRLAAVVVDQELLEMWIQLLQESSAVTTQNGYAAYAAAADRLAAAEAGASPEAAANAAPDSERNAEDDAAALAELLTACPEYPKLPEVERIVYPAARALWAPTDAREAFLAAMLSVAVAQPPILTAIIGFRKKTKDEAQEVAWGDFLRALGARALAAQHPEVAEQLLEEAENFSWWRETAFQPWLQQNIDRIRLAARIGRTQALLSQGNSEEALDLLKQVASSLPRT